MFKNCIFPRQKIKLNNYRYYCDKSNITKRKKKLISLKIISDLLRNSCVTLDYIDYPIAFFLKCSPQPSLFYMYLITLKWLMYFKSARKNKTTFIILDWSINNIRPFSQLNEKTSIPY